MGDRFRIDCLRVVYLSGALLFSLSLSVLSFLFALPLLRRRLLSVNVADNYSRTVLIHNVKKLHRNINKRWSKWLPALAN